MKVELRKWSLEDKASLIEICNRIDRSYLSDRLPNPYTNDSAEWWINMANENEGNNGVFREIVVNDKIIGTISVERKEDVYRKDAEIGYYLLQEEYSKGIMTKAVEQICEIAFRELDIIRITGLIYEPNIASRRVLEKNGFSMEGVMKNAVIKNEAVFDLCIYGKLK
ncbi:MAG: GNAT family N-acetyltransferase [Eubacteriales bacterium]|nr:GNAT family N-acetyltransferase [Eubacteriales bacterium]